MGEKKQLMGTKYDGNVELEIAVKVCPNIKYKIQKWNPLQELSFQRVKRNCVIWEEEACQKREEKEEKPKVKKEEMHSDLSDGCFNHWHLKESENSLSATQLRNS